jgi:hypothetical protein
MDSHAAGTKQVKPLKENDYLKDLNADYRIIIKQGVRV